MVALHSNVQVEQKGKNKSKKWTISPLSSPCNLWYFAVLAGIEKTFYFVFSSGTFAPDLHGRMNRNRLEASK